MLFDFLSSSLIGLDIQSDAIRLAQLKKRKHGFEVTLIAKNNLSEGIFFEGKIKKWDLLHSTLEKLINTYKLNGKSVAIGLPLNLVRTHEIQIPSGLTEAEIEIELISSVHNHLPGLKDSLAIDYICFPKMHSNYMKVFFAATRKEYLSTYVDCINSSGLKVKIVDVDVYALKRAISWKAENNFRAIIQAKQDVFILTIFKDYEICFYQSWHMSESENHLEQIKQRLQLFQATIQHSLVPDLVFCGDHSQFIQLYSESIYYSCLTSQIKFCSKLDSAFTKNTHQFLLACGLAMRDVPVW